MRPKRWIDPAADGNGDGVGSVVAVGVTWQRKRASGPSGKNTVPKRTVRIPDATWAAAGEKARAMGADRNQVINELLATWLTTLLTLALVVGCSSRDTLQSEPVNGETPILTVCALRDAPALDPYIEWAVNYWAQRGHAVEWAPGPDCLVRVRVSHHPHVAATRCYDDNPTTDGWCNGVVGIETHQEFEGRPNITAYAPAAITMRLEPWEKFDEAWRNQTLTHEVGHALGLQHSGVMPMRSCERQEWCYGDLAVHEWWAEQSE